MIAVKADSHNHSDLSCGGLQQETVVLLGAFNVYICNEEDAWMDVIGRNSLPHQKLSSVLLLDFSAGQFLANEVVHRARNKASQKVKHSFR